MRNLDVTQFYLWSSKALSRDQWCLSNNKYLRKLPYNQLLHFFGNWFMANCNVKFDLINYPLWIMFTKTRCNLNKIFQEWKSVVLISDLLIYANKIQRATYLEILIKDMVNLIAIFICNIMTIWSFGGWLTYHNNIMDFSIVLQRLKKCCNLLHSLPVFVIIHLWKELCLPLKLAILRIALCNVISLWDHGNIWRLKTVHIGRFYSRQNCQY